jgi:hypothetical protein
MRLPDGRIVVAEHNPPAVLLFDRDGSRIRTLARDGDGPGELRNPGHLRFVAPDTIWAWSAGYGPGWALDTTGTLLNEHIFDLGRLRSALGDTLTSESHYPLPSGAVVVIDPSRPSIRQATPASAGWAPPTGSSESTPMLISREYRATTIAKLSRSAGVTGVASGTRFAPALAMPVSHVAVGSDRFHLAHGAQYAVNVFASDGTHLHQIRKVGPPARWDDTTFERSRRAWLARYGVAFGSAEAQRAWDALPDQRFFPPINGLVADDAGGVWVRESLHRWNIFDESGAWVTSLDVPLHRILQVGSDFILGIARDRDDVETVVELFLGRTSSNF